MDLSENQSGMQTHLYIHIYTLHWKTVPEERHQAKLMTWINPWEQEWHFWADTHPWWISFELWASLLEHECQCDKVIDFHYIANLHFLYTWWQQLIEKQLRCTHLHCSPFEHQSVNSIIYSETILLILMMALLIHFFLFKLTLMVLLHFKYSPCSGKYSLLLY